MDRSIGRSLESLPLSRVGSLAHFCADVDLVMDGNATLHFTWSGLVFTSGTRSEDGGLTTGLCTSLSKAYLEALEAVVLASQRLQFLDWDHSVFFGQYPSVMQLFPTLVSLLAGASQVHGSPLFFPPWCQLRDTVALVVTHGHSEELSDLHHHVFVHPIDRPLPHFPARLLFADQWHLTWDGCGSDSLTSVLQNSLACLDSSGL